MACYDAWSSAHMAASANRYWSGNAARAFKQAWWAGETGLADWQKATGLDQDSAWEQGASR